jgi:hypothetical protein
VASPQVLVECVTSDRDAGGSVPFEAPHRSESGLEAPVVGFNGTVALRANDAEPASIGVMAERPSRGTHVFTMHLNTRFSAHLMLRVGSRGSMQQCRSDARPGLTLAAAFDELERVI